MTGEQIYQAWCARPDLSAEEQQALADLAAQPEALADAFGSRLSFGTAGLRGKMGMGPNRIGLLTIAETTAGFAQWLLATYGEAVARGGIAIAYDTRNNGRVFAQEAARVLAVFGIPAYVWPRPVPTPVLSFTVRHLGTCGGIMITASHNTKEYNGYKVYDDTGCQLQGAPSLAVAEHIAKISLGDRRDWLTYDGAVAAGFIHSLADEVMAAYIDAISQQAGALAQAAKEKVAIAYTPLHGTGYEAIWRTLTQAGYNRLYTVEEQNDSCGDFPTLIQPNPEDPKALAMGIALAKEKDCDLVLGTDPDGDRIGVAVQTDTGYQLISGNQMGALLVDYLAQTRQLPADGTVVTTVVTSAFGKQIARHHGLAVVETLTGFKYIGAWINDHQVAGAGTFCLGYEESYGYLIGDHARDKDAIVTALLICEMAAWHKEHGRTLTAALAALYQVHGYCLDALDNYTLEGATGRAKIAAAMASLRQMPPAQLAGESVNALDYQMGVGNLPKENMIQYTLAGGSWVAVRPSGTEPKLKCYYCILAPTPAQAQALQETLRQEMTALLGLD